MNNKKPSRSELMKAQFSGKNNVKVTGQSILGKPVPIKEQVEDPQPEEECPIDRVSARGWSVRRGMDCWG